MNGSPDSPASPDTLPAGSEAIVEEDKTAHKRQPVSAVTEFGGPAGPEPTRYGDWEKKGRCYDF